MKNRGYEAFDHLSGCELEDGGDACTCEAITNEMVDARDEAQESAWEAREER